MSVEELEQFGRPSSGVFDRTPPQDVAAEQSVLGGMLISKDAIADVIEQLRSNDFYRPAHETIYDAILDLQEQVKGGVIARTAIGTRHGFDRASIREPVATLFDDVHHAVPRDLHDQPVTGVVTPTQTITLAPARR